MFKVVLFSFLITFVVAQDSFAYISYYQSDSCSGNPQAVSPLYDESDFNFCFVEGGSPSCIEALAGLALPNAQTTCRVETYLETGDDEEITYLIDGTEFNDEYQTCYSSSYYGGCSYRITESAPSVSSSGSTPNISDFVGYLTYFNSDDNCDRNEISIRFPLFENTDVLFCSLDGADTCLESLSGFSGDQNSNDFTCNVSTYGSSGCDIFEMSGSIRTFGECRDSNSFPECNFVYTRTDGIDDSCNDNSSSSNSSFSSTSNDSSSSNSPSSSSDSSSSSSNSSSSNSSSSSSDSSSSSSNSSSSNSSSSSSDSSSSSSNSSNSDDDDNSSSSTGSIVAASISLIAIALI